jgi:16S rRNA (uracil1498-N3)-methyltransferase
MQEGARSPGPGSGPWLRISIGSAGLPARSIPDTMSDDPMNRFFLDPADIQGDHVLLGGPQAHQIGRVLRLVAGERIVVLDNCGWEYEVVLTAVASSQAAGRVVEKRPACGEPAKDLVLYQSLLARDKFELVLQKCTEVGVRRFVPVVTERSVVRNAQAFGQDRLDRWGRILTEAAEQSERGRVPELRPPVRFEQAVAEGGPGEARLLACPRLEEQSLKGALAQGAGPGPVALLIGPEAGLSDREVDAARSAGWRPFNLGRRILRTETAAVVASALVLYELGQMEPGMD